MRPRVPLTSRLLKLRNVISKCVRILGFILRCMFALHILLINTFVGKIRRGKLVNWVEKGGFKKIQKLLEIFERE